MFTLTHGLIAGKVYETLKSEMNLEMNFNSLVYGSIAPDIQPSMMRIPHSLGGSIDVIIEMAQSLM